MSAQANIVLADGTGTPVNHTFEPNGAYAGNANPPLIKSGWVDRSGNPSALGQWRIREDDRPSQDGSTRSRCRWVVEVPTVATVDGKLQVTRTDVIDIEIRMDPGGVALDRDHLAALAKNFTASAYFQNKVKTGERTW